MFRKNQPRRLLGALILALALPACADESEPELDRDEDVSAPVEAMQAIATITLAEGNLIEFYELSPGMLVVSESGAAGVSPLPKSPVTVTPLELYRALEPNQPAPAALVAAQARADLLSVSVAPTVEITQSEPSQPDSVILDGSSGYIPNQGCDDQWFEANFCGGSYHWKVCYLNQWDGAWAYLPSVDHVTHAVCADLGDVTLSVKMGDGSGITWWVSEGYWRNFWWNDTCWFGCNTWSRGDVLDAAWNRFHYSVRANF